jgi:tetratricopeptide (TPR) repeat protein
VIAQDALTWIGKKVVAKYHYPIKNGDLLVEKQNRFHVYSVERTDADRLWVVSGSVQGWIPVSQVVLFDKAIDFYTKEITANPGKSAAWGERGIIWAYKNYDKAIAEKNYDKAIADFSDAIRLEPTYALAHSIRGIAWAMKHEYEKAFTDLNQGIRLNPKDAEVYTYRGFALICKEEYDKAIADFNESIRLDPKFAAAYTYRGCAWGDKEEYGPFQ